MDLGWENMEQARKEDFCVHCREVRPYSVVRKNIRERIRDKVMIMLVLDLERFSVSGEPPYTG